MGIRKWYEVVCDVCGEVSHMPDKNKNTLAHFGYILKGKKVYCCEECANTKLADDEIAYRDNEGKLCISKRKYF